MRVSGQRFFSAGIAGVDISRQRFWQIAILTGACTIAAAPRADAALFYWQDSDPSYYRPVLPAQPRKQKVRRPSAKTEAARKETSAKPHGPLIIADLDRAAKGPGLRQQRVVRRKSGLDRHEGAFDPDGRVQRHSEEQDAPLQHL